MPRRRLLFTLMTMCSMLFFVLPVFSQSCDGTSCTLINPIGENNIQIILGRVVTAALGIIGSITFVIFIYGGFLWLTSGGSEERVKNGTNAMLYAAIGLFIIFASYAILNTVIVGLTGKTSDVVPPPLSEQPTGNKCYCTINGVPNQEAPTTFTTLEQCNALDGQQTLFGAFTYSNCSFKKVEDFVSEVSKCYCHVNSSVEEQLMDPSYQNELACTAADGTTDALTGDVYTGCAFKIQKTL